MIFSFNADGLLPPDVHWTDWNELMDRFGHNRWRLHLMRGLKAALENLRDAGCQTAYIDGSFVTRKAIPNDYDACWEETGVDPVILDPVLLTFDPGRATQKAKYLGEFFQTDRETERAKGIVAMELGDLA